MRDFRLGIGRPWDQKIRKFVATEKQRIANDHASHKIGHMGKLVFARHIAHGKHVRIARAQPIVNVNPHALIVLNASGFEAQAIDCRLATAGHQ